MENNWKSNGVVDRSMLLTNLPPYGNINDKIHRMIQSGELIQLKRGKYIFKEAYETHKLSKYLVANALYGPSYVSFYTALEYHGMIQERVEIIESATIKRSKSITTVIGQFQYQKYNNATFAIGLSYVQHGNMSYLMALPTKALVDVILTSDLSRIYGKKSLYHYLIYDLRIDKVHIAELDITMISQCLIKGTGKRILQILIKLIETLR